MKLTVEGLSVRYGATQVIAGLDLVADPGKGLAVIGPNGSGAAMPGARLCVHCQSGRDRPALASAYNRRGSKDSQLR